MSDNWLDKTFEGISRKQARLLSRRGLLARLGAVLVGTTMTPVLPVFRSQAFAQSGGGFPDEGDSGDCQYWRYCAMDGYLCGCCGGSPSTCPPGTVVSDITWIGTCRNPVDDKHYVISYNDCCGKSACGSCLCTRDEGDTPAYRPQNSNNLNWCAGSQAGIPYHCSLAVVIGVKE